MPNVVNLSTDVKSVIDQDYTFLKTKNEQLVKELAECKSRNTKFQTEFDFMMKEKFSVEEEMNSIKVVVAHVDERAKKCFKKVVECSTELTSILKSLQTIKNIESDFPTLNKEIAGTHMKESFYERMSNQNLGTRVKETNPQDIEESPKSYESNVPSGFIARGGSIAAVESEIAIQSPEMDDNNTAIPNEKITQYSTSSKGRPLSVIEEDIENSVTTDKSRIHSLSLEDASSELLSQFFEKFPNTNVNMRRNKYSEKFKNSDLSISVEPDSPIQNSRLATDDISTTARTQSLPKKPISSTPKRPSIVQRKSLGSPHPSGSEKRKSFVPFRRSLENTSSKIFLSTKDTDIRSQSNEDINKNCSHLSRSKNIQETYLESMTVDNLHTFIENTSTPIIMQNKELKKKPDTEGKSCKEASKCKQLKDELMKVDFRSHNIKDDEEESSDEIQEEQQKKWLIHQSQKKSKKRPKEPTMNNSNSVPAESKSSLKSSISRKRTQEKEKNSSSDEQQPDRSRDDEDDSIPLVKRRRRHCTLKKQDSVKDLIEKYNLPEGTIFIDDDFDNSWRMKRRGTKSAPKSRKQTSASPNKSKKSTSKKLNEEEKRLTASIQQPEEYYQPVVEVTRLDIASHSKKDEQNHQKLSSTKKNLQPEKESTEETINAQNAERSHNGRRRRLMKNVLYKEPSLHVKLRRD